MSFSVDDPYELIQVANSLNTSASESTIMLIMYISERFGRLGSTVNEFPGIPRDEFDSVVRDDFEPRLLEVGTDSTSTGESLIGMAATLKQFHDQVPQVKSAAANLEQVLNQSSSPAEWKAAAAPLASALNNLYSVSIPSAPAANQSLSALAQTKPKSSTEDPKPAATDSGKQQDGSQPLSGGAPSGAPQASPSATPKQQSSSNQSEPASEDSGSGGGSGGGSPSGSGSGSGGGSGGGSPSGSGSGAGASPSAGASDAAKKPTNAAAALPSSSFDPLSSTGLQSADLAPSSSGLGLGGGAGGGVGAGGLDPKSLGAAPGSAASLAASGAAAAGAPAGAARGMSSMMGGMMGQGMMGGRGGGGEKEHKAPDYLYSEDNGYELIEKLPVVSPDVIGALTDDEVEAMELQTDFAFSDPA